ncbi:MAG: pitrilysin family protein [Deltaproteobacteria bacterium]
METGLTTNIKFLMSRVLPASLKKYPGFRSGSALIAALLIISLGLTVVSCNREEKKMDNEASTVRETTNGITKYQLENGMTVILEENHSSPVVAVNVWVETGSACENEGEYGLAHVHEHMVFKGTDKRDVGEIARVIESSGGDINAFTSFDETVYYVVIASRFLDTALDVLSDAMENSAFNPAELEKELEVVVEEIRRGKDSPGRNLSEMMFSTAFSEHPYGRPVIGSIESVRSFDRKRVTDFYHKWYAPNNMILVVVGDFDPATIEPKIAGTFGKLKRRELPECNIAGEPEQGGMRTFVIDKPLQEGYFSFAYHIMNAKGEDTPAVDVMANILGGGESSRLFRNIKEEKGLANNIYSYAFTPKREGILAVGGSLDPARSEEALEEIIKEINRLKYEPVSDVELSRVKVNIQSDAIYTKETMQGQAQKLGFFEVETDDFRYEQEYLDKVRNVTAEDVMRVAKKYLTDENLTAGFLLPTGQVTVTEDDIKTTAAHASEEAAKEWGKEGTVEAGADASDGTLVEEIIPVDAGSGAADSVSEDNTESEDKKPAQASKAEVKKFVLDNGITVLIKENRNIPLFAARAAFLGGVRYEEDSTNGVSNFVSRMLTRGTKTRSAAQIAQEIESIAGEVQGFSGKNSFGVTVESLSDNFDEAMDIFSDVLLNPSFDPQETDRARREILAEINRQGDNLLRTTVNMFLATLYSEHPYKYDTLGTVETVSEFDGSDLSEFYRKYARPENMVISVVGDVGEEEVLTAVKEKFGTLKRGRSPAPEIPEVNPPSEITEKVETKPEKAQTHIIMGFHAPTLKGKDHYAFEVLNTILSGQGGRLFIELRDKKSLAYTVTSFYTPGLEPGYFGVYIGTAPEKEQEAVSAIKEQLEVVLDEGVTDDEMKRAQNYLVGNFEIGLQQNSSQAAKITFDELYGIGWDEYKKYPEEIYAVTKEDVQNAAKKYIDLDKYTLVIVKPEEAPSQG